MGGWSDSELGEAQEEDTEREREREREREMHVMRVILDVGEYALYLLCGRQGVDSHHILFSLFFFSLCENSAIIQFGDVFNARLILVLFICVAKRGGESDSKETYKKM